MILLLILLSLGSISHRSYRFCESKAEIQDLRYAIDLRYVKVGDTLTINVKEISAVITNIDCSNRSISLRLLNNDGSVENVIYQSSKRLVKRMIHPITDPFIKMKPIKMKFYLLKRAK